jgi:2-oxoglutarate ferredoxin oxidoreductase subunit gamma
MRQEVRLAGFGGQGIVLAGYILGKAATLYGGKEAILTQSYGPEARGGACSAELVVDDQPIDYPTLESPDILVLMSQEAFEKYGSQVAPGAAVMVESDLVEGAPEEWPGIPASRLAEELGARISANIVMLGFLIGVTRLLNLEALEHAISSSVPERTVELNLKAFAAGYEYAQQRVEVQG